MGNYTDLCRVQPILRSQDMQCASMNNNMMQWSIGILTSPTVWKIFCKYSQQLMEADHLTFGFLIQGKYNSFPPTVYATFKRSVLQFMFRRDFQ